MASWLDKARGRETSNRGSTPFQLQCECGSRISGVRSERAKRQVCSECGSAHFILPENQYPETERSHFQVAVEDEEPVSKKPRSRKPAAGNIHTDQTEAMEADLYGKSQAEEGTYSLRDLADAEESESTRQEGNGRKKSRKKPEADPDDIYEYDDEDLVYDAEEEYDDIEADLHGSSGGESTVIAGVDEDGWQRTPLKRKRSEKPEKKETSGIALPPAKKKRFLPVLLAFGVIAAGMIYWVVSSQARENAEIQLKESMDIAEREFFDGNYPQAYQALLKADEALQILEVTDERAKTVRALTRQADAATHLLDGSVMELVETAAATLRESSESQWKEDFSVNFEGRWFVMQLAVPDTVTERSRLNYDWIVDGRPIQLDGLGTIATWAVKKGGMKEILCAGRLQNCRRDRKAGNIWVVEFDPHSAFLWTDETSLIRQNMIPVFDDSIATAMRKLVKKQREIGDAPPPPPPLEEEEEEEPETDEASENDDGETEGDSDE